MELNKEWKVPDWGRSIIPPIALTKRPTKHQRIFEKRIFESIGIDASADRRSVASSFQSFSFDWTASNREDRQDR